MAVLIDRLRHLQRTVPIGIVGIGSIGRGMVLQADLTPGIDCLAIADIDLTKAITWAEHLRGQGYEVAESLSQLNDIIRSGKLAVCADGELLARSERIEIFVEATSSVEAGGRTAITAMEHGKHAVMMNYEADLMFGPYLARTAQEKGVVYTVCDGDQPTVLRRMINEMDLMGFELVMAGNMKGFLDRYSNPTSIIPEADKRGLDHKMCASYTDGTKLCVEMAVLANGLGMRTCVPGMLGPRMETIHDVFDHFDFENLWEGRVPLVDYVLSARPKGGVFAIGYTDHPYQQATLAWFPPEMGPGPFYLFYRPYHLGHLESMATIAEAALDGCAVLRPDAGFRTNVYCYAKRDIKRGDRLDGAGGYACYGMIENSDDFPDQPGVPICISEAATAERDIPKDERVRLSDVSWDECDYSLNLYRTAQAQSLAHRFSGLR